MNSVGASRGALLLVVGTVVAGCGGPPPTPPPAPSAAPVVVDPRVALLEGYAMDDAPPGAADADLVEALAELRGEAEAGRVEAGSPLSDAIFDLFRRTRFSWPKAQYQRLYRVLNGLLKAIADPRWQEPLIAMLEVPVESTDRAHREATLDQMFWQLTACEVLGAMRSEAAVPALLKVTLTPFKAPAANDAMIALLRIGEPALKKAVALMEGRAPALVAYAEQEERRFLADYAGIAPEERERRERAAPEAYLRTAILVVANLGTEAAVEPMLEPSGDRRADAEKAANLHLLPSDPRIEQRFIEVYDQFTLTDEFPNGDYPKYLLLDAAKSFYSPAITEHLLATAFELEGSPEDRQAGYAALIEATVGLATPARWPTIEKLLAGIPSTRATGKRYVIREGGEERTVTDREIIGGIEDFSLADALVREEGSDDEFVSPMRLRAFMQSAFKAEYVLAVHLGRTLLDRCQEDVRCYLRVLADPEATRAGAVAHKAAGMIAVYGDASVKPQLVDLITATNDEAVHREVALLLLHFSPEGDPAIATRLRGMLETAEERGDRAQIDRLKPFKQVIYRLEARGDRGGVSPPLGSHSCDEAEGAPAHRAARDRIGFAPSLIRPASESGDASR